MKYKIYKRLIAEGLRYLSDRALQQKAWLEDNDICSSFSDEVESVYLDSGLEGSLYKKTVFDNETDAVLKELNSMIEAVGYERDERELIDAPEMEAIRQKAAEALRLVQVSDHQGSTVEIIEY